MSEEYVNYLTRVHTLDELKSHQLYLKNRTEALTTLVNGLHDVKYVVHRYDLLPKKFHEYLQWLQDELCANESERRIVDSDLRKEEFLREQDNGFN